MNFSPHHWLCRCLAPDAVCPTADLTRALDRPGFAWEPLLALAHRHLVAASWYAALRRRGLLERAPVEIGEHLAALHELSLQRNRLLRRELIRAACACNALDIEPVLLKGALALLPGQPPEMAARLLGDLDLLLPADRIADGRNALQTLGYYATHAEDHCAALGTLELRQILDLVQFRARDDAGIAWPLIQARGAALGQSAALNACLRVTGDWFGQPLPGGVHSSMTVAWLEWKFEYCRQHPRASRGFYWLMRLKRLPKRLLTPSWYPAKIHALRRGEPL